MTYEPPVSPPQTPYPYQPQPLSPPDQRLWSTLIHIGGIIFWILPALIGYLVLKDRGMFVRDHTKTALNFQITMIIVQAAAWILTTIGSILLIVLIGIPLLIVGVIASIGGVVLVIVLSIIAAITANRGELYAYPSWCTIAFVK
ncbi:DUF4870 domain-containing protein [soil metagenome]